MRHKKSKKKPKPKETNPPAGQTGITNPAPVEKDESFDFGGLPDRNLKKNLGCG